MCTIDQRSMAIGGKRLYCPGPWSIFTSSVAVRRWLTSHTSVMPVGDLAQFSLRLRCGTGYR
jgi:hypothetical protein